LRHGAEALVSGARRGFTLLEVLVATAIMAIAVTTALAALRTSLRNAGRQVDLDRASTLARSKMDELLVTRAVPHLQSFGGDFPPVYTGGREAGWEARITPYELFGTPPQVGSPTLERIQLEVWWRTDAGRQQMHLEAYRPGVLTAADAGWAMEHGREMVGAAP
jgi:general secretion pathway protein I